MKKALLPALFAAAVLLAVPCPAWAAEGEIDLAFTESGRNAQLMVVDPFQRIKRSDITLGDLSSMRSEIDRLSRENQELLHRLEQLEKKLRQYTEEPAI